MVFGAQLNCPMLLLKANPAKAKMEEQQLYNSNDLCCACLNWNRIFHIKKADFNRII